MPGSRKLGRVTAHRLSMLRGMVTYLLDNGSVETTVQKAKDVRAMTEKMITLGKENTLASRRAALAYITKEEVVKKLFDTVAPSFKDVKGGYTQVYKLGCRRGDGAEMAIIKLSNKDIVKDKQEKKEKEKKAKEAKETKKADDKKADDKKADDKAPADAAAADKADK